MQYIFQTLTMFTSEEERQFIKLHLHSDVGKLSLSKQISAPNIRRDFVLNQISAYQKSATKLPSIRENLDFIFPPSLSIEQASSEITAKYKSEICSYSISADLTGGMGIDSIFLAKNADEHYYNELSNELAEIFSHNVSTLNIKNITAFTSDAFDFISKMPETVDLVFFDPARRNSAGRKTYFLEDTFPNPAEVLQCLQSKNFRGKILIKTSPLLDISRAINLLSNVAQVHVISINNECKELLFLVDFSSQSAPTFHVYDHSASQEIRLVFSGGDTAEASYSDPKKYIYEPLSGIYKLGFWGEICERYGVEALSSNSHLFTSGELIADFPGRKFEIEATEKVNAAVIRPHLEDGKANIATRNFPQSVDELRKSLKIKDGGGKYLFFTTLSNKSRICLICRKLA